MNSLPNEKERQEIRNQMNDLAWYHSIDLGNGLITDGRKKHDICKSEAKVVFKHNIKGKSVLDVGTWSGFFSFEAYRRGASRVLSTDSFAWDDLGGKPGFDFAKAMIAPEVEELNIDVMDLTPDKVGEFDVVMFLGVLYHMRHPILALDKVSSVCTNHLIIETHMGCSEVDYPAGAFYPTDELGEDPSNWWGFNEPAIVGMLKDVGFTKVEYYPHPVSEWSQNRGFFHAFR